jgi:hypothetical protein
MAVSRLSQHSIQNAFPKGNTVWDGTTATSAFDSLGAVLVSTATSTITFSSIPQTYQHLQIRAITRNNRNDDGSQSTTMSLNGDTTFTNYRSHLLYGGGTSAASESAQLSGYYGAIGFTPAANFLANTFSSQVIDLLDYTNTSKNKTVRTLWGTESNGGSSYAGMSSFLWMSNSAITSISISSYPSASFVQHSHFALYGIK